jgi:RNA polymerase sigma-70 factor (ECF subfamily)
MSYTDYSDQELISGFIDGESRHFEVLMNRYKDRVYTYIYLTVKDRAIAEDIFQDTFIKVIHSLKKGTYSHDNKFVSWVMRIAHNLAIDYFRKKKQLQTVPNKNDEGLDIFNNQRFSESTVEDKIVKNQINDTVRLLIDELPDDQREVIILRHYVDMSFKEIAEKTGVSINTALGRMRYAVLNLRKLIEEKNLTLTVK